MRKMIPGLVALVAAAAFSVWAYPQLPAEVATHFDLHGQPNGWSSRFVACALVPMLGVLLLALFSVLPRIDPRRANYPAFITAYWMVVNAVLVFLAGIHVASLGKALGWPVDITRLVLAGIGALFVLLGVVLPRVEPNWFMGIRTPWTLSSDTVWRKTHRFGGVAFMAAGLVMVAAIFVRGGAGLAVALGSAGCAALASVVYSYVAWRQEAHG